MSKIITKFRVGFSSFHYDLYLHNVSDNSFCLSCEVELESLNNLFLECSVYSEYRSVFMHDISQTLSFLPRTDCSTVNTIIHGAPLDHSDTSFRKCE